MITAYITTVETKNGKPTNIKHNYRMTPAEVAQETWEDEMLVDYRRAGVFKFAELISDLSAQKLWRAVN
jgi:hypothetical protein